MARGWKKARVGPFTQGALYTEAFKHEDPRTVQNWREGVPATCIQEEKDHARFAAHDRNVAMTLKRLKAADAAEDAAVAAIATTEKAATTIQALVRGYQARAKDQEPAWDPNDTTTVHRLGVPREDYQWDQDKVKGAAEDALGFSRWEGPYPEDAWFHEVTGGVDYNEALKKLEEVGLSLDQVGGSGNVISHDIVPYGEDWRYVNSIYITIFKKNVEEDPKKLKMAIYNALPKDRPFDRSICSTNEFEGTDFYRPCWYIESCKEELPLLEAVGIGADDDLKMDGIPTYCAYPLDKDDERYVKLIRLCVPTKAEEYEVDKTKIQSVVEKALGMKNWQSADGYDYLECRLDTARDALLPLDLEPDELEDEEGYYWIAACEDDERYMLNPPVDSELDCFED